MKANHQMKANHRFNPTLVRLRRVKTFAEFEKNLRFQSHAGSIEAFWGPIAVGLDVPVFQSHAGSIEAGDAGDQPAATPPRFNPTLVRLRPSHPPRDINEMQH